MSQQAESEPEAISFAKLAETSPTAITRVDKDGHIIYANKKAEEVLGLEESEITDRTYDDVDWKITDFEGNEFPKEKLPFQRVKNTEEPVYNVRHAIEWPDGERKCLSVNASPLFDDDGNFDGMVAVLEDITDRRQLEKDLETSEKRYRRLFETAQDGMLILKADTGKIIDANPYIRDLLGFSKDGLVGKELWEIGTFRDVVENKDKFEKLVEEGYVRYEHLPLKTKSGREANVEFVSNSYMVDGQRVVQCNIRDITERKKTERKLRESERKYRTLFETTGTAILIIEEDTTISLVNKEVENLTGYSAEEIQCSSWKELVARKEDLERMKGYHSLRREESGSAPNRYEFKLLDKDGSEKDVLMNIDIIPNTKKSVASLIDITDKKNHEQRLRQSFVQLAETTSRVLGVRDPYTQQHEQRVAELAREVGERMGLKEEKQLGLYLGGLLHDIGKIAVPPTILTKPGELEDVEWEMIKSHPEVGYNQILADTDFPWPVAEMTLHHHERLDGSGYPDGLQEGALSLEVRILGAVDVVEAMSTRRPYRAARSKERTISVITEGKEDKFDPEVVAILVEMIDEGEIEFGEG